MIHIYNNFHEILLVGYLVMALFANFAAMKGNNPCIIEAILTKFLYANQCYGHTNLL